MELMEEHRDVLKLGTTRFLDCCNWVGQVILSLVVWKGRRYKGNAETIVRDSRAGFWYNSFKDGSRLLRVHLMVCLPGVALWSRSH